MVRKFSCEFRPPGKCSFLVQGGLQATADLTGNWIIKQIT